MKKLIMLLPALLLVTSAGAEGCFPDGITFSSQSQVNSYRTAYPECSQILGDVTICGPGITNLNGLSIITSIQGSLIIECNALLTSLNGLDNLASVAMDVFIEGNPLLENIEKLSGLSYIGGNLIITNNPLLENLHGLEGVFQISGKLWIEDNVSLESLLGLDNLSQTGGLIRISANQSLQNFDGLASLTSIGGSLVIGGTGHLGSIGNPSLTNITGLSQLTLIEGSLQVENNISLASLAGLDNILPGSISDLSVYGNSLLSHCEVSSVCSYLSSPGSTVMIEDNAPGCNSAEEVREACLIISVPSAGSIKSLKICPNPFSDRVQVEISPFTGEGFMQIISLQGRVIREVKTHQPDIELLLPNLPVGVYMIRFLSPEGSGNAMVFKQ